MPSAEWKFPWWYLLSHESPPVMEEVAVGIPIFRRIQFVPGNG